MGLGGGAGAAGARIGHNGGPQSAPGQSWRTHCWRVARESLLPTLPIEVVRRRVARAADLGLDYKTYAGLRAQTGHDLVAFLFSSNALRVSAAAPLIAPDRAARLAGLRDVQRIGLAIAPLTAQALTQPPLQRAHAAPGLLVAPRLQRAHLRDILGPVPGDRVLLIADQPLEADWALHGRLAGWLPAARFFGA